MCGPFAYRVFNSDPLIDIGLFFLVGSQVSTLPHENPDNEGYVNQHGLSRKVWNKPAHEVISAIAYIRLR